MSFANFFFHVLEGFEKLEPSLADCVAKVLREDKGRGLVSGRVIVSEIPEAAKPTDDAMHVGGIANNGAEGLQAVKHLRIEEDTTVNGRRLTGSQVSLRLTHWSHRVALPPENMQRTRGGACT